MKIPTEEMFAGYYGNPEATMEKVLRNVLEPGDMWFRSGDLLRRTNDGYWYFVDRLGDTFRWKSENVSTMVSSSSEKSVRKITKSTLLEIGSG